MERVVGLPGAVLLGLGSIVGTGVFVSLGLAAGVAGPWVLGCVVLAAGVATLNGLSSAQLAASYPVSGGTYEYGYRVLTPAAGFLAGWMFLCAKSASAATAALGFAGYVLTSFGVPGEGARIVVALAMTAAVTGLVAGGMTRSNRANAVIVSLTLASLAAFVLAGLPGTVSEDSKLAVAGAGGPRGLADLLHGTALMFVAYTGYGRIATLGEEVSEPHRTIPRAIVTTLAVTALLYTAVAWVALAAAGSETLASLSGRVEAPLETIAEGFELPGLAAFVALGAVTAMLGVLLNLVLGLSRVWLAMARRGDAPRGLAEIDAAGSPRRAVLLTGGVVAGLVLTGSVRATWSFSAFTVLVYYALTNLAALRLAPEQRFCPRWVSTAGLAACLGLAFWVEPRAWGAGLALAAAGLLWHAWRRGR